MTVAVVGLVVAMLALVAAAAAITTLAIRGADLQVKLGAAELARKVEADNAAAARADLADYRARAGVELANLRASLETLSDAPHVVDPVVRRARWSGLLGQVDAARHALADAGPAAAAGDVLPGLDGGQPAAGPAGGGAAGPGPGRPAP